MFKILNHSSENMREIYSNSIDLIITEPPYNIGLVYDNEIDLIPQTHFIHMLKRIFCEISRVSKKSGRIVILVPIKTYTNRTDCEFSKMLEFLITEEGFHLVSFHKIKIKENETEDGIGCVSLGNWQLGKKKYSSFHSQEHRVLFFCKTKLPYKEGINLGTYNYEASEGHPCPSNWNYLKDILNIYFKPDFNVLDPFMGTCRLGELVIRNQGNFFGCEVSKIYFDGARRRLISATSR